LFISSDAGLERIATEKRLALIKAWEESEKNKSRKQARAIFLRL
jgi:hypothetical protein